MTYKQIRRKLTTIRAALILAIFFLAIGAGCLLGWSLLRDRIYNAYIGISASTDSEVRRESYLTAITIDPSRAEAFNLLLDVYGSDGVFSAKESEEFLSLYNRWCSGFHKNSKAYAALHQNAAFLYINGYEDTPTVCLRMAIPFLETALEAMDGTEEEYRTVQCYGLMGAYYRDYIWNAASVRDVSQEEMENLLTKITETLTDMEGMAVYDRLGFYSAVCNLLYDQRDTIAATCRKDLAFGILDKIFQNIPDISTLQKEKTIQAAETLLANESMYRDMLERAYARREG